jgi:hypothetical protein
MDGGMPVSLVQMHHAEKQRPEQHKREEPSYKPVEPQFAGGLEHSTPHAPKIQIERCLVDPQSQRAKVERHTLEAKENAQNVRREEMIQGCTQQSRAG